MIYTNNRVVLTGNLGNAPNTRITKIGTSITNFPMATNRLVAQKDGTTTSITDWHFITAFDLPDSILLTLEKGKLVHVEGSLQNRSWVDDQNITQYRTQIIANLVLPIETAKKSNGNNETTKSNNMTNDNND